MFTGRRRAINKKMTTIRLKLKAKLSKIVKKTKGKLYER